MAMKLTYQEVQGIIGEYLGVGSAPSGNNLVKIQKIIKSGYRKFLSPLDLSGRKPQSYRWKFLEQTTTISTQADTDTYTLPKGFNDFVTPLTATTQLIIAHPRHVTEETIYNKKATFTGTGYPEVFALKTGNYDEITGQLYEVIFWPTPSGVYSYWYTYIFSPPELTNDNDVFVGDDFMSEVILESCLAVAEQRKYDNPNQRNPEVHAREAEKLIQAAIGKDKNTRMVSNLGKMTNGPVSTSKYTATTLDQNGTQISPV